jgi:hypothetical protein
LEPGVFYHDGSVVRPFGEVLSRSSYIIIGSSVVRPFGGVLSRLSEIQIKKQKDFKNPIVFVKLIIP